jgi:hypothetical protein
MIRRAYTGPPMIPFQRAPQLTDDERQQMIDALPDDWAMFEALFTYSGNGTRWLALVDDILIDAARHDQRAVLRTTEMP